MKSISKWLVPGFLRRLDQYLRERYPVIWYSGAHWVLFYGLLGGMVLFGAGLLYPVHWVTRFDGEGGILDRWVVDPIKPIEFAYDEFYIYSLILVFAVACIWMYRQFQLRPFFYQVQHSLFCLLIYVGCWWVLCGITAAAFRMGTIVKTAWFWMPERDLQDFKNSGIYPYGFVLFAGDTTEITIVDTLSFFKKREEVFRRIWENEGTWLKARYRVDPSYWNKRLKVLDQPHLSDQLYFPLYPSYPSDQSYQLYRPYLSYLSDRSYLSENYYLLDLSCRSYHSYRWGRAERVNLSFLSYLSDFSALSYRPNRLYIPNPSIQSIYHRVTRSKIKHPKASAYNLINHNINFYIDSLVMIPSLSNQIEDAVRSVEHARQFSREGIFLRYFFHLFYYLLFFSVLVFLLPWVSARNLLQLFVFAFLSWIVLQFFRVEETTIFKIAMYLVLPIPGLLLLLWMQWQEKLYKLFCLAVNMVFLGLLTTLVMALLRLDGVYPTNAAFYSTQLIGLLAACVVPYVQAMPKAR